MKNLLVLGAVCAAALLTLQTASAQEVVVCSGPDCSAACSGQGCGAAGCSGGNCSLSGWLGRHDMATKGDVWAQHHAKSRPWHGQYYYMPYGQPTALVVPPNAVMQQNYSWGVSQNTSTPIYHQFGPAAVPSAGGPFYATPIWPSHTNQFGVYPVRAPW